MELLIDVASAVLIFAGCFFVLTGSIGVVRMPDLYTRIHAASLIDTGGTMLILLGLFLQAIFVFDNGMAAIKLILILFFINFSGPTASHALAKMAMQSNVMPESRDGQSAIDESIVIPVNGNDKEGAS